MINDSMFTSNDHTWETPQELFDDLNSVFYFNTDVCASTATAKCEHFFSEAQNGLVQNWTGSCWCNPPYGREQIEWVKKAYDSFVENRTTTVMLIPARPDTKIWQNVIFPHARAICFIKGRIRFSNAPNVAPFPSAIVVFSRNLPTAERMEMLNKYGATQVRGY